MPLDNSTLDQFAEALSIMHPDDRERLKPKLALRLGGGADPGKQVSALLAAMGEDSSAADIIAALEALEPDELAKVAEWVAENCEEDKAVTAAGKKGGTVERMARRPTPSPEASPSGNGTGLVAAGGALGIAAGARITDRMELARVMADTLTGLDRQGPSRGRVVVASARWSDAYPEERKLHPQDALGNGELIEAVCGPNAPRFDRRTGALTATGGICQPVNVDYSIETFSTPERPIRDGLPAFEATRGGIRFVQPPDIAEWEAASGVWSSATDLEPGSATKPVKSMTCGTEEKVEVEAISTRIGFGNMQGRFAPEQVAANTDLATAAAARVAEENLLNLIEATCVKKLETAAHLGLSRDLLAAVDYARAAYKAIHRTSPTQPFTAIFPDWVKDLIKTDIAREQAHSNNSDFNVWEVSDEQIDDIFARRYVNVIWHLDGQKEPASTNYKTQYWGTPAEGKKLDELLPKIGGGAKELLPWYFFPEGAIQLLDGGRLDLGVVRDSTLDATNDMEVFWEVFESIANRGVSHGVWQILSGVAATGGSAATVTAVAP
jgi:hypothetical protein